MMRGHGTSLAIMATLLLAACEAAGTPSPSVTSQLYPSAGATVASSAPGPGASATEALVPSPVETPGATPGKALTPDPLTVEEAGTAFLAAEGRLRKAWSAATDKYDLSAGCALAGSPCNKTEMKAGKAYWAIVAAALGTYVEELKAIQFPDVAGAAAACIKSAVIFRDRALAASKATTLDTFSARVAATVDARDGSFTDDDQQLKDALGLPVGP
jgi:hypothetical protein